MTTNENQIIFYQPNSVMQIDVHFDDEPVGLLQPQIAELFSCSLENIGAETNPERKAKEIGKKCFGFTKMDTREIEHIKKSAFGASARRGWDHR